MGEGSEGDIEENSASFACTKTWIRPMIDPDINIRRMMKIMK